ncbi:MAG: ABC transporter ATP-binding protein [Chromatiales bacterium]|jgi:iron complex transport system ATP-binding protein
MTPLVECHRVSLKAGSTLLTRELEWELMPGECWGILGPNGSGKTTLLQALAGLHPVSEGEIRLCGTAVEKMSRRTIARHAGLLFQETHYPFPLDVRDLVLAGRYAWQGWSGASSDTDEQISATALAAMRLERLADRPVNTLSGGERRRVALATLLSQQARVQLLDEPENHLDPGVRLKLLESFIEQLDSRRQATVMVLHEPALAVRLCTHLLLLFDDGSYELGETGQVATEASMSRLYGTRFHAVRAGEVLLFYPG